MLLIWQLKRWVSAHVYYSHQNLTIIHSKQLIMKDMFRRVSIVRRVVFGAYVVMVKVEPLCGSNLLIPFKIISTDDPRGLVATTKIHKTMLS
ncbi:hypothetical protein D3C81_2065400 [compost metagenome]